MAKDRKFELLVCLCFFSFCFLFSEALAQEEIIIDNSGPGTSYSGVWNTSEGTTPYGANSLWSRNGATFTWSFFGVGTYEVAMWWSGTDTRATEVAADISSEIGTTRILLNQHVNAGRWISLGSFPFNGLGTVSIIAADGSTVSTCADAVKFTLVPENAFILDNRAADSRTGIWSISGAANSYGQDSEWSRDGSTLTWTFVPYWTKYYDVYMWWTAWPSRSADVPVDIESAMGTMRVHVDQRQNEGRWNLLKRLPFEAGIPYRITVTAQPGPSSTCADAIKLDMLDFAYVTIDNRSMHTSRTGDWLISSAPHPFGADSLYSRDGSTFTWKFTPALNGYHDVMMWWTPWPSRSTSIPVDIESADGTRRVYINQSLNGGKWNSLLPETDSVYLLKGVEYRVTIHAQPGPSSTCADAVRFGYKDVFMPHDR